jgi:hypothetical protein
VQVGASEHSLYAREVHGRPGRPHLANTGMQDFFAPDRDPLLGRGTAVIVAGPAATPTSGTAAGPVAVLALPEKRPGGYQVIVAAAVTAWGDPLAAARRELDEDFLLKKDRRGAAVGYFHRRVAEKVRYGRFDSYNPYIGFLFTAGLEVCQHYLLYYRYSGDEEFLRRDPCRVAGAVARAVGPRRQDPARGRRLRRGEVRRAEIESLAGRQCVVANPWPGPWVVREGGRALAQGTEPVIRFPTRAGGVYRIEPAAQPATQPASKPVSKDRPAGQNNGRSQNGT